MKISKAIKIIKTELIERYYDSMPPDYKEALETLIRCGLILNNSEELINYDKKCKDER